MQHTFAKKHFSRPTWCAHCEKFIWGLGKQGFGCKVCSFPSHPKCVGHTVEPCPGVKTKWGKKTLEKAKKREEQKPRKRKMSVRKRNREESIDKTPVFIPEGGEEEEEDDDPIPVKTEKPKHPNALVTQPSLARISAGSIEIVGETIEDVYTLGKQLGTGAFSVVKQCTHIKTGEEYAVKVICKKNVKAESHRLALEMKVLGSVKHPNIIELKEVFETDTMLYIVTELVSGGELFDRIIEKGTFTEKDAALLVRKCLEALDYLHDMDIVHRDLKPENLLLKSRDNDTEVKLADFGLSKIVGQEILMQTACGTPGYVAPEILMAMGYGKGVDMWSMGVIAYILLCGFPPFYNECIPLLFESIMKADFYYPDEFWEHISDDAVEFIDALLVVEPTNRLTAKQALNHPWIKNAPGTLLSGVGPSMKRFNSTHIESKPSLAESIES